MKVIHANGSSAMKIYGGHSPHPVIAETTVVNDLGGPEQAFHALKALQPFWVRSKVSETWPFSVRDLELTFDNQRRGYRHWRWESLSGPAVKKSTGYDFVKGYSYRDGNAYVFVDGNNNPVHTVHP